MKKRYISHSRTQIILLILWLVSLSISCYLVYDVIHEIEEEVTNVSENFNIRHSDQDCEQKYNSTHSGDLEGIVGRLNDRGLLENQYCSNSYIEVIIQTLSCR